VLLKAVLVPEEAGFYEHDKRGFSGGAGRAIGIVSHETRPPDSLFLKQIQRLRFGASVPLQQKGPGEPGPFRV
jgi:hypothetical protein